MITLTESNGQTNAFDTLEAAYAYGYSATATIGTPPISIYLNGILYDTLHGRDFHIQYEALNLVHSYGFYRLQDALLRAYGTNQTLKVPVRVLDRNGTLLCTLT